MNFNGLVQDMSQIYTSFSEWGLNLNFNDLT